MAYTKRTWLGRQGTGLNKFSIGGASPVTIVNQPDSVTQVGDALSAGNLNDLEDRIEDAFDDVDTALDTKADEQDVTDLNNAITAIDHRLDNLEQAKGKYVVSNYKDGAITPSGKGAWSIVEGLRGVSRVENNLIPTLDNFSVYHCTKSVSGGVATISGFSGSDAQFYKSSVPMPIGQTALGALSIKSSKSTMIRVSIGYANIIALVTLTANVWTNLANVLTVSGSAGNEFAIWLNCNGDLGASDTVEVKSAVYTNLSVYFGGTIPSDADTIAEIQTNYPHLLIPSDYGTRIVDSSYSGVRAWARNLAQTNPTYYDSQYIPAFDADKCYKVTAGVTYYWKLFEKTFTTWRARIFFYDMEGNPLTTPSTSWVTEVSSNGFYVNGQGLLWGGNGADTTKKWTFSQNFYIRFCFLLGDTTSSSVISKFCFNVSDANDGTYTPYHAPQTLSLTFQGKSAGSVFDSCEPNVEVGGVARKRTTERVKVVVYDGSSDENWQIYGSVQRYYIQKADLKINSGSTVPNLTCDKLKVVRKDLVDGYDKAVGVEYNSFVLRIDSTITTVEQLRTWLAQNPVTINYELNTPVVTLSDPLIDNTLLTEAYGRMSTVQTGTVVDGSFDLGFITL